VKQLEDTLQASQEAERAARAAAEAAQAERDAATQREAIAKAQVDVANSQTASLAQAVASRDQRLVLLEAEAREGAAALQATHNNVRTLQGPFTPRERRGCRADAEVGPHCLVVYFSRRSVSAGGPPEGGSAD